MKLKNLMYLLKKPWFFKMGISMGTKLNKFTDFIDFKRNAEFLKNEEVFEARKKRVMDAITMKREPDRIPTTVGGLNFFPAKYAGITCAQYMFDAKKMKNAYLKTLDDFDFDLLFPSFMLGMGGFLTASQANIFKLPGRDIGVNSSYQYNEIERLKADEYEIFLRDGMDFFFNTITRRVSPLFDMKVPRRLAHFTRTMLELGKFMNSSINLMKETKVRGHYNMITSAAFPPLDIISIVFRDLRGLAKDMLRKKTRGMIIELCEKMEPWLTPLISFLGQINEEKGIWFTSERAFSLSPRQFETYYWPMLKKMIVTFVKNGHIPFLLWEADVTHLVHFLLELPTSISRRCLFMCDTSDIFEVNKILDGHMCITGNIPLSTMCVGTPKDVEKYCEKMFAELKPGGGFINGAALGIPDEARPENVHAMIKYTHEYGRYV